VSNTFSWLERRGYSVTRLPVNSCGQVELSEISQALRDDTILVSVQHVNSETGSVQPIRMIGKLLSGHQAVFHSDMVQSFCKIPVKPAEWGIQSLSVSAHKIHGPKGLGAAYLDPSVSWSPFIPGSVHENSFRPGTVDVPAVVSFAAAAREADSEKVAILDHVQGLKKTLLSELEKRCKRTVIIQGSPERSSPYITGLSIYGMEGQYVMLECSQRGLAMSTGSACQVNEQKPSPTLLAMGKSEQEARSFIRLSMDRQTTRSEVEEAVEILAGVVEKHLKTVRI
ncbi:MAG: IscS subfamily cysteine desulfurase, partial [Balneolaceae bacterium]